MSFVSPWWLLALAVIPALLLLGAAARRRRRRYVVRFPAAGSVAAAAAALSTWRRRVPAALLLAALVLLALGLARPRVPYRVAVQQASVVLVSDHSGSMAAQDVQPTRLAAAIRSADSFIGGLPGSVRIGAVTFGNSPDGVQEVSADHSAARNTIDSQMAGGATDTGDALTLALQLLRGASKGHPPAAIVLLSDGSVNTGADPATVARLAASERIPIYTVALGTPNGTLNPDPLSAPVAVPPDPQLMAQIARLSGGRTFDAQSAGALSSIYGDLARELGTVSRRREITAPLLIAALVLSAAAALGGARRVSRLP